MLDLTGRQSCSTCVQQSHPASSPACALQGPRGGRSSLSGSKLSFPSSPTISRVPPTVPQTPMPATWHKASRAIFFWRRGLKLTALFLPHPPECCNSEDYRCASPHLAFFFFLRISFNSEILNLYDCILDQKPEITDMMDLVCSICLVNSKAADRSCGDNLHSQGSFQCGWY